MARKAGVTAEQTKARLIAAAAEVFAERGYEGARVEDIAKAAGLSTGAIYAHYANKAELLLTAIQAHSAETVERAFGGDQSSVLDSLVRSGTHLPRRSVDAVLLLEGVAAGRRDPELLRVLRESITGREGALAEAVRAEQHAGKVHPGARPDAVAHLSMLIGLGSIVARALELAPPDADDWQAVISGMVDSIRHEQPPPDRSIETATDDRVA